MWICYTAEKALLKKEPIWYYYKYPNKSNSYGSNKYLLKGVSNEIKKNH